MFQYNIDAISRNLSHLYGMHVCDDVSAFVRQVNKTHTHTHTHIQATMNTVPPWLRARDLQFQTPKFWCGCSRLVPFLSSAWSVVWKGGSGSLLREHTLHTVNTHQILREIPYIIIGRSLSMQLRCLGLINSATSKKTFDNKKQKMSCLRESVPTVLYCGDTVQDCRCNVWD